MLQAETQKTTKSAHVLGQSWAAKETAKTVGRLAAAMVGAALVSMLIIGSFAGALHRPTPHGLPVAVVAPPPVPDRVAGALAKRMPGAFHVSGYQSEGAAREAVLSRKVDGALVVGNTGDRLLVAGAEGPVTVAAVTAAGQAVAASAGQHLVVDDLRPLPAGNPGGSSQVYLLIALSLPSIAFGAALARTVGAKLRAPARLASLVAFALLVAFVSVSMVDGVIGALAGAPFSLFDLAALCAFAIAAASAGVVRLLGLPFVAPLALLLVIVGTPAGGGPYGAAFVSPWYAHLGSALPAGAMLPAVRDVLYFHGHALGGPLLVLSLWAGLAALVQWLPALLHRPASRPAVPAAHEEGRAAPVSSPRSEAPHELVTLAVQHTGELPTRQPCY
jgi:hypothetical protein